MNEKHLFRALENAEEEFIEEAVTGPGKRRHRSWWVAAACLALLLTISVSAVALTDGGAHFKEFISNIWESGEVEKGYDISVTLEKISPSDIRGPIADEAPEKIRKQIAEYKPYMSHSPDNYTTQFDSAAEGLEFIGYKHLKMPDLGWTEVGTFVNAYGNQKGQLRRVRMETDYEYQGLRMQAFASIYTTHHDGEIGTGSRTLDDIDFSQASYVTKSGIPCVIMYASANNNGYYGLDGYMVADNVFYNLHVIYQDGGESAAEEALYQWLDAF